MIPDSVVDWLIKGEDWVEYSTRLSLLDQSPTNPKVIEVKKRVQNNPLVQGVITELTGWPGKVIASHKNAGQPFHKLTFLADIGLTNLDPGIPEIIDRILARQSDEGPFQLLMNIGEAYGGDGQNTWGWALCDAPLILYALVKFGMGSDSRVKAGINYLISLIRENGWPCAVSKELGSWRGPGKKDDPCPFANLAMLKLLSTSEEYINSPASTIGIETLLNLWGQSSIQHPYIFYMGTDFRKLKVPFIWYDLMHTLEVLSHFPQAITDSRYQDMLGVLNQKMNPEGQFTLESIWTAWKDWEFGQKKIPSRWLTLSAWKIMARSSKALII